MTVSVLPELIGYPPTAPDMVRVNNEHLYVDNTAPEKSMGMPETPHHPHSVTLSLPPAEQWTLHHVLLDRIEQEATATEPSQVDPPPVEVFGAFETLDAGDTSFTIAQLEAIQPVLAEYHHSPAWESDRARLERLLHRVTEKIDQHQPALPTG